MSNPDWDKCAELGELRAVIDHNDSRGFKNQLIDQIQWSLLRQKLAGSKSVLDFGCGTGRFAFRLHHLLGAEYSGVDTSAGMIRVAKENHKSENFVFLGFNGLDIPFPDNSFDAVTSCGVVQYIIKSENCQQVLSEIRRVLVPGGRLVMIEQASQSNQTSGPGMRVLTESDYQDELSKLYVIRSLSRARSCEFSKLSRISMRIASRLPWIFNIIKSVLAWLEIKKVRGASNTYMSSIKYYDILIDAASTKLNNVA